MTDIQTIIDTYIKNVCTLAIQDALPQIKDAVRDSLTEDTLVPLIRAALADLDINTMITDELDDLDIDDKIRDYIRNYVSVSIDC